MPPRRSGSHQPPHRSRSSNRSTSTYPSSRNIDSVSTIDLSPWRFSQPPRAIARTNLPAISSFANENTREMKSLDRKLDNLALSSNIPTRSLTSHHRDALSSPEVRLTRPFAALTLQKFCISPQSDFILFLLATGIYTDNSVNSDMVQQMEELAGQNYKFLKNLFETENGRLRAITGENWIILRRIELISVHFVMHLQEPCFDPIDGNIGANVFLNRVSCRLCVSDEFRCELVDGTIVVSDALKIRFDGIPQDSNADETMEWSAWSGMSGKEERENDPHKSVFFKESVQLGQEVLSFDRSLSARLTLWGGANLFAMTEGTAFSQRSYSALGCEELITPLLDCFERCLMKLQNFPHTTGTSMVHSDTLDHGFITSTPLGSLSALHAQNNLIGTKDSQNNKERKFNSIGNNTEPLPQHTQQTFRRIISISKPSQRLSASDPTTESCQQVGSWHSPSLIQSGSQWSSIPQSWNPSTPVDQSSSGPAYHLPAYFHIPDPNRPLLNFDDSTQADDSLSSGNIDHNHSIDSNNKGQKHVLQLKALVDGHPLELSQDISLENKNADGKPMELLPYEVKLDDKTIWKKSVDCADLLESYKNLVQKQTELKNQDAEKLNGFITKFVPYGIPIRDPKVAEYETFKSDKSANFLNDGNGHIVFREFRRIRLSDVLGHNVHPDS